MIDGLIHLDNYGPMKVLVQNGYQEVNISDINSENYYDYFNGTLNIMRDGIENPEVQSLKVGVTFADGNFLRFILTDWWFNMIFWTFPIYANDPVTVKYLFDTRAITKSSIKSYFDMLIKEHIIDMDFMHLNNLLDETMYKFKYIDEFAMYLSNTLNFKDTLDLMAKYPEFNASIHVDFTGVPIEDVKSVGMEYARKQIKYITESNHCLRDSFIAKEAIAPKQFKEVSVNIGTKPDGQGGVFPYIINNSFINGGVSTPESYFIDSSVGRTAQILQKVNVADSGLFSRLLETNNIDSFFHPDVNYECDTKNFITVDIKDSHWLNLYDKRYYRFSENGPDYVLDRDKDFHLIGKTLLFRSPITCASHARGQGICRKCYGDLYYVNRSINPGTIAAELLGSIYTQMLLSAKHILESSIIEMKWNDEFYEIFDVDVNMISINDEVDTTNMYMVLDSNTFDSGEDESDMSYEESTTSFHIIYPDGNKILFKTADNNELYLTEDLNRLMKSVKDEDEDGIYTIPLDLLKDLPNKAIFTVSIQNNELQRTLERSKQIINRTKDTVKFDKDSIVREFISTNAEGGINVTAIHLEVIISNQVRDKNNLLEKPNWSIPNAPYRILSLSSSLNNSPSITVNLEYQKIGKTLVSPISNKKRKPSIFDLFFMENPQDFVVDKEMISDEFSISEGMND